MKITRIYYMFTDVQLSVYATSILATENGRGYLEHDMHEHHKYIYSI